MGLIFWAIPRLACVLLLLPLVATRDGTSQMEGHANNLSLFDGGERMLVLSRKTGEKICIGEDIFVEVRRISGNRVSLAISAPRSVRILRGELKEQVNSFDVLEETEVPESAIDTVIIKGEQSESDGSVPEPHLLTKVEASQLEAK